MNATLLVALGIGALLLLGKGGKKKEDDDSFGFSFKLSGLDKFGD